MEEKKNIFGWDSLEENLMGIAVGVSLVLMLVTFFAQSFLSPESITALQQMSFYAYAWVVGFALSTCARDNKYLRVPLLEKHLPPAGQRVMSLIQNIASVIVLAALLVIYVRSSLTMLTEGTMDSKVPFIPLALVYIAMAVGFLFANIRNIIRLVKEGT